MKRREEGQILVMFAAVVIVLIGISALVVDIGMKYSFERRYQSIADTAEWTAQRRTKAFDAVGRNERQLCASERSDGDAGEVRMCVEVRALAGNRLLERRAMYAAGQLAQCRLDAKPHAVAE